MVKISRVGAAIVIASASASQSVIAQDGTFSAAGFTGLSATPTAKLLPWGTFAFSYANEVVGGPATGRTYSQYGTSGHNFVGAFGILPSLEVSGRIATNTLQSNCYSEGCGLRDLSFNFKSGIAIDEEGHLRVAAGGTDFGGRVSIFRSLYGVATYSLNNTDYTVGYAKGSNSGVGGTKPLDGIFGSAAYRPFDFLQAHVEYNDSKLWTGARVFFPTSWLPQGWSAHVAANLRIRGEENTSKSWLGFGIAIPLYKVPSVRSNSSNDGEVESSSWRNGSSSTRVEATAVEFSSVGIPRTEEKNIPDASAPPILEKKQDDDISTVSDAVLEALSLALSSKGFEDIAVGRSDNGSIVIKFNNATYNVNSIDGLGVALGVVSRHLSSFKSKYVVVMTQRQIDIVGVTGQADCLEDWIQMRSVRCVAGELHTPGLSSFKALTAHTNWIIKNDHPSWMTARLSLSPVIRSGIATDYGVLDYSAGLRATVQQPFWAGSYVEVSHVSPVSNSRDFEEGKVFGTNRVKNTTDRALFHQVVHIPLETIFGDSALARYWGVNALTAHAAFGRIDSSYRGKFAELRWEPFEGRHRVSIEGGAFDRTTVYDQILPNKSKSLIASYRYSYSPTRTYFEISGGQFLYNDRGLELGIRQWFDDVSINLYFRRTKFDYEATSHSYAGVEVSIPLTPRKDMNPKYHVQITGSPRWTYGVETRVSGTNFVSTNQGVSSGVAVLDKVFNSDRAGVFYFEDNMARIRSAAAR